MENNWKRNTVLFLVSQTISLFGSSLVMYAISWYIVLETQSGVLMTIAIICGFLPTFFLSPFAGVWADRYNRKILIVASDALIAAVTLVLAVFFFNGHNYMWMLFIVSAIRALGTGVQIPAVGAFIPQMVPEDKLTKINATNGSIQSLIMLVAPMASGALLTMTSIEYIFLIDVITAAAAISVMLLLVKVPPHEKAQQQQTLGYIEDMKLGFGYIRNHGYVKRFFLFCGLFFFMAAPVAFLSPLQVTRTFGDDVWRLTAIEIAFSIGMMAGGILMASWGGFKNRVYSMALSCIITGIFTFALGVTSIFWIYLIFMAIIGISMPVFNTPSTVLLQEKVEPEYLGRVFGAFGMISSSMMPLGMLVFGPTADYVRIEWLLVGTGLVIFIQSFFLLGSKVLLEAGKPAQNTINQEQ